MNAPLAVLLAAWLAPGLAMAQLSPSPSSLDQQPLALTMPPPPAATRKEPEDRGFVLGLRLGYGFAFGRTSGDSSGVDLGKALDGALPVELTVAYRSLPWIELGLTGSLGPLRVGAVPGTFCDGSPTRRCGGWDARVAFAAQIHFRPAARLDPWLGLGFGYEVLHVDIHDDNPAPGGLREGSSEYAGLFYLEATGGLGVRLWRGLAVGPFLGFTLGRFARVTTYGDGQPTFTAFSQPALHEWLTLGIAARYAF